MADETAPAGPVDSGNGGGGAESTATATPEPEPSACQNCVKLLEDRKKIEGELAEALTTAKADRAERNKAVKNLNELVASVAAGKAASPEPASAPAPAPAPAATGPKAPSILDRVWYAPKQVPGHEAWYAARDKA